VKRAACEEALNIVSRAVEILPHDDSCDLLLFLGVRPCDCPKGWLNKPVVLEARRAMGTPI
jgi:hypothetical protein